jgi:hypothetical protein
MGSSKITRRLIVTLTNIFVGVFMTGVQAEEVAKPLNVEYERAGLNFASYDSLLFNELDVSNTKIVPPPWKADKPFKWKVADKNVAALQAAFQESMLEQISANEGYPIVTEADSGVLEISVKIVSFMPYAERKENVTTKGSGEMRIHAELRDAQSEELLAIYEGVQEVGQDYGANSDFTRAENLKALFDHWGKRIRHAMDEDHGQS